MLSLIPTEVVSTSNVLKVLAARVVDAVEAIELGESVYPASIPPEDRWKLPAFVPDEEDGHPLVAWRPGRLRRVDETGVELVYAESPEQPDARELHGIELSHAEWQALARGRGPRPDAFVIFAEYQGGSRRLFHWPAHSLATRGPAVEEDFDSLRYVRQWLGTVETSST